jgi:ubiquinone/menaquinone biosynthesis C-methylase UbiE
MQQALAQPTTLLGRLDSLADPVRLRLLRLLEKHELAVADLCDVLQLPQSTVSRHLKILADQHWLRSRREATAHLYHMTLEELDPHAKRLWILAKEQTDAWPTVGQDDLRLGRLLRDKQQESQQFFATAAAEWDRLRAELYGHSFSLAASLAILPADYVVADLGCGTGQLAAELAPHVERVIAVDNSPAMLSAAKQRTASRPNVDLRHGNLEALPVDAASCDAAMTVLSLTYVADPTPVLHEMARILKPGGRAVIVDLLSHARDDFRRQYGQLHLGFSADYLTGQLAACGLADAAVRSLPPEPNTRGPALFLATAVKPGRQHLSQT